MAMNSDVRDILELESDQKDFITKEALLNDGKKVRINKERFKNTKLYFW